MVQFEPEGDAPPMDGRHLVIGELGHGGMARVYLAALRGLAGFHKLVVLKSLRRYLADDPEFYEMFLNEARLAARLNHPNVVQTYEVNDDGGVPVIVMEYLDGQPLSQILLRARKGGRCVPMAMLLQVLADTLAGLHHAHELEDFNGQKLQLVHRDVSPQNIFVTFDGCVKILDFGIAKAMAAPGMDTEMGKVKGKVRFMAPEQISGKVDRRADIFGVGVMLWEACTGQPLWKGESDVRIMRKLVDGDIPHPRSLKADISQNLERICMKALAPHPADRYATAADFANALEEELRRTNARIGSRDIGRFVAELFSDVRAARKTAIEAQLGKLDTLTSGHYRLLVPVPLAHSVASTPPMTEPTPVSSSKPAKRPRAAAVLLALALLGALATVTIRFLRPARLPQDQVRGTETGVETNRPLPSSPASAAASDEITIELASSTPGVTLFLDEERLPTNPFRRKATPDGSVHALRGRARGYHSGSVQVTFDKSSTVTLTLAKAAASSPPHPSAPALAPTPVAPASSAASGPKAANCAAPYYIDDRGIKKIRAECL
ncbi:serine/threonine protein kinase [Pendulispora brunnea]|uniref:Serine/threonine protein kinase n=1 Tax=Pendulispora brunnea TaxID=2905690 RepID=A0ABZ2KC23_9BACT